MTITTINRTTITSDQEAFYHVKEHLLIQDEQCRDWENDCQYRGYKESTVWQITEQADDWSIEDGRDISHYFNLFGGEISQDAKCAVGALIEDIFYNTNLEGTVIEQNGKVWDVVRKSNPVWKMTEQSFFMMKQLQSIHDRNNPELWNSLLNELENQFNPYGEYTGEYKEND